MTNAKKPTQLLKEEHTAVLQKLTRMEEIFRNLDKREAVSSDLKELAAFFKAEFWTHFDKEERALFPEFDNFMPRGAGPLAVMLDEHEVLRNTNDIMQEGIERYLGGDEGAETKRTIVQSGSHFIDFLRSHINKEDGILFAMADMHLSQAQNEKVVRLFQQLDRH